MSKLEGKVAVITGAGSGIGQSTAHRFAADGAAVMVADLDEEAAQSTAAQIAEHGGKSAALAIDVADEDQVIQMIEQARKELGGLDVVYNNAGIGNQSWDQTIAVNLSGVYYGLLHGCEALAASGGGSVISTSSIAGLGALVGFGPASESGGAGASGAAYVASKHGVIGLTRQFAIHYARAGVRVNAIAPGYIHTPLVEPILSAESYRAHLESLHPMGRLGQPEEIASTAAFLASDDASFITGAVIPVDGGYSAR